ncbi:MAG: hypothetical protein IID40_03255, partial [Planctomycetes bacterium]|nr:hypothetical protein [Planctomycetota bacterium]
NPQSRRRRAAVAAFVVVTLIISFGFASLTIDVGLLYNAKADLQRTADAAALAGASAYLTDAALAQEHAQVEQIVIERAIYIASQNPTLGTPTVLETSDVVAGYHDYDNPAGPLLIGGALNAVQATARRTADSPGGSIPLLFAAIWSKSSGNVSATARAAFDDRFAGYNVPDGGGGLLPFAIHEAIYEDRMLNGTDNYSYDNAIANTPDGVPEVSLFPWKWNDTDGELVTGADGAEGSGNFGTLNIGLDSLGASALGDQILTGITAEQLETEIGTSQLTFVDENGDPQTYTVGGNPGLSVSISDAVEAHLGEVISFFLHSGATGQGAGATYEITGIRFARLMEVQLSGSTKVIVFQPVAYTDSNIIVQENAPSTNGQVGRIMLVQ